MILLDVSMLKQYVKKIIGEEHSELDFILFFTLELLIDPTLKPKQIHET